MYSKLLEPGYIGKMEIKNRIVVPPMLMGYGSEEGYVTEQMLDYFEERAKGGAGMVICEVVGIRYEGKVFPYFVNCYDESHVPGLAELATRIKKHGARAAIQIGDGGRNTRPELTGERPIGVSAIGTYKRDVPREMTTAEVEEMVARFARATSMLKQAGFEGVEMHAAHVYLLNQFLSPLTNARTDKYGGSLENRCRVLVEIVEESRKLVGPDFPIWIRINQAEPGDEGGLVLKDAIEIAKICEKAGYDAIHVSSGGNHYETTMASMYFPHGYLVDPTAEIKKAVNIPVIAVGRMTPQIGDKAIRENKADFIAFGRGSMVDPEFPNKLMAGNAEDIKMCMNCMTCVARGVFRDKPIVCAINPVLGKEKDYALKPVEIGKNVMIIGGGPAGLEAAQRAVDRGHKVTLVESDSELGGQLRLMSIAPKKEPIKSWINYMGRQLKKAGVEIKLGTDATAAVSQANIADAVIVATGMKAGISQNKGSIVTLQSALAGKAQLGETVAIVGGDQMALEAADYLSEQGKKVCIFTDKRKFAPSYLDLVKNRVLERLADKNVVTLKQVRLESINPSGLRIITKDGAVQEIKADTIVLGNSYNVDTDLLSSLRGKVSAMYLAGGCRSMEEQIDAVADGFWAGNIV